MNASSACASASSSRSDVSERDGSSGSSSEISKPQHLHARSGSPISRRFEPLKVFVHEGSKGKLTLCPSPSDFLVSIWDRRKQLLYTDGSAYMTQQIIPTPPESVVNGTECYDS